MLVPLLLFLTELLGIMGLASVVGRLCDHGRTNRIITLLTRAAIFAGYIAGGFLAWLWTRRGWRMSFWDTLTASVNAEKYGHPTEHYAESVLVLMLFACAAGALLWATIAAAAIRLWKHPRAA